MARSDHDDPVRAPGLHLLCWFYRDGPWNIGFDLLNTVALSPYVAKGPDKLIQFVETEFINKYGAEAYLNCLTESLRVPDVHAGPLCTFLGVQRKVLENHAFDPCFGPSGFLRALCDSLERETDREDLSAEDRSFVTECILDILTYASMLDTGETALTFGADGSPTKRRSPRALPSSYASPISSGLSLAV